MATKGLIFCNCLGKCPSFKDIDEYEVLNTIRKEKLVDWVALHPQLCAEDGDEFLKALLKGADVEKLFVAGCDPTMQRKMFKDAMKEAGFDPDNHVGIEVRNMKTEEVIEKIRKAVKGE